MNFVQEQLKRKIENFSKFKKVFYFGVQFQLDSKAIPNSISQLKAVTLKNTVS